MTGEYVQNIMNFNLSKNGISFCALSFTSCLDVPCLDVVRYDIALDSGESYMEVEKELFPCLCYFGYKSPQRVEAFIQLLPSLALGN